MDQNPQPIDVTPNQTVNQNLAGVTGASQIPSGGQRLDIAKPFISNGISGLISACYLLRLL